MTLQDVAERAGTSRTTAHYVLTGQDREMRIAEETRRRVRRAANELSYRPNLMARGLRTQVTRTIALVSDTVATDGYAGGLVYGALAAAAERGYLLFVCETEEDPELEEHMAGELTDRRRSTRTSTPASSPARSCCRRRCARSASSGSTASCR